MRDNGNNPINRLPAVPRPLPAPRADIALVLHTRAGPPFVITTDRLPRVARRFVTMYEVNVAEHSLVLECELPCANDVGHFKAGVSLVWKVCDPARVVQDQLIDVRMALEPWVRDQMRQITAGLEVRDRAKAETTINDKFREKPVPVDDLGLEIRRYTVTLDLDEAARHYVDRLIEDERKKALEKLEREMDQERADFYEKAMANGRYATAALRLARRPDDFPAVAQTLQKEEAAVIDRFIEIYKATVNASALEEDQIDRTLKALQREFGRMQGNSADMALGSLSLEAGTPPSEPDGGGGEDDEER